jgi:membrane fusion protein, multidrug efflux system
MTPTLGSNPPRNNRPLAPRALAGIARLGAVLALAGSLGACDGHAAAATAALPSRSVRIEPARLNARATGEEVVGTVRSRHSATLAPTVTGTVKEVRVAVGSPVRAGQVLVRLSAREIDAKLDQARAVFAHAKLESDRAEALKAANAIPTAQLDAARAQLHIAEAAQDEASTMAEHTVVRAPFSGVVTAKATSVGDTAMPGQPLLVVEQPDALRFEASVPETEAHALAPGRRLEVRFDALEHPVVGTVAEVSPTADPASRTVTIKLDLPPAPALHSGLFGRMVLPSGEAHAVAVPASALVRHGQLEELYVVSAGTARLRLVKTGRAHDGIVELVSGVDDGELIATSDVALLVDGQPVRSTH